jgi:hypothetical protein
MNRRVQDLLKKIMYIEADIEIHKQILFSIPANDQKEMERAVEAIAGKKREIDTLRQEIQDIAPEEHEKILILEKAVAAFQKLASEKKFKYFHGMNSSERCCLSLKNEHKIDCLVKACDEDGRWTIITMEGELKHFSQIDIDETPGESIPQ